MRKFETLYEQLLLLSIFFVLTEIALHMPMVSIVTPYKITLGLLCLLVFVQMIRRKMPFVREFFGTILQSLKTIRPVKIPVALYLIFDIVSLAYTDDVGFALTKYVTILSMLAILLFTAYYIPAIFPDVSIRKKVQRLLLTIGLSAIAATAYAYIYHTIFDQTFYARRLSMIEDYNQFSIVIIFGYFVLLLFLRRSFYPKKSWFFWLVASSAFCISAVTLSGSRRSYMMMLACLLIPIIYETICFLLPKPQPKQLLRLLASLVLIGAIYTGITKVYNDTTTERYEEMTEENQDIINMIGAKPVEEILTDEQALGKREIIWQIAIDGFKDFSLTEKLFGAGGSYASDVYDTPETKPIIEKMYWKQLPNQFMNPHNFILVDLLNGGIVKTIFMIASLIGALYCLLKNIKKQSTELIYTAIAAAISLGNIFVSSKFGYLNDKFVWTALILVLAFELEYIAQHPLTTRNKSVNMTDKWKQ